MSTVNLSPDQELLVNMNGHTVLILDHYMSKLLHRGRSLVVIRSLVTGDEVTLTRDTAIAFANAIIDATQKGQLK